MNFTFVMQINIKVFQKLILSFWLCITRHAERIHNKSAYLSSNSRKAWAVKFILYMQINNIFLQIDNITLGVHGQACPKHPKQQLYNILAISQGKCKGWSLFFPADNCQTFLQSDTVIFDVCCQTCPNYPKLFLCNILREK